MSMNYRNKSTLSTGLKIETVENTAEVLTAAEFVGDWVTSGVISPKYEVQKIDVGGSVGANKYKTTKVFAELPQLEIPSCNGAEGDLLKVLGAYVTGTTTKTYAFGGTTSSSQTAPDKGRLSVKTMTFSQYDGMECFTLSGARPTAFKIGAKDGEIVKATSGWKGFYSKSNSGITLVQKPTANINQNACLNAALTIDGAAFLYSDFEIDFKPVLTEVKSASTASGYASFELSDFDPTFTITLYPGDPATKDALSFISSNAPVNLAWSYGSGTGNSYAWTAKVQFDSEEITYEDGVQVRKIVMKPYADGTLTTALQLVIS